jgi:hypothetical protein
MFVSFKFHARHDDDRVAPVIAAARTQNGNEQNSFGEFFRCVPGERAQRVSFG